LAGVVVLLYASQGIIMQGWRELLRGRLLDEYVVLRYNYSAWEHKRRDNNGRRISLE
jgi:hypothetical protein